jgi:hypothetical protein
MIIHDLAFAAYLSLIGKNLTKVWKSDEGKFNFQFEIDKEECNLLEMTFINSDFAKYDANLRKIKSLLYKRSQ